MTSSLAVPFPGLPSLDFTFARCSVKGCIFPAAEAGGRLCLLHQRAEREPSHFLSVQPSSLCLDQAKYGVEATAEVDDRGRDRRRLTAQLHRFRNELA